MSDPKHEEHASTESTIEQRTSVDIQAAFPNQPASNIPGPSEVVKTSDKEKESSSPHGATLIGSRSSSDSDPLSLRRKRRANISTRQIKDDHPGATPRQMKKFYNQQNDLIDQFLNSGDEERLKALDTEKYGPRVKFAVNGSFVVNVCLFAIQLFAAIDTGSLALFATAADAFTEAGRSLGDGERDGKALQVIPLACVGAAIGMKAMMFVYCFLLRRYPAARIFMYDHRNDIAVNVFGLIMSVIGEKYVWWLDPFGAICIGLLILLSWITTAFEHVWLLVGKGAPKEFIGKVIYMTMTHDRRILKVDTCRAYHAGQQYYVEVDIIMDEEAPLKVTHDVSQTLQRKIEGLADVERAFVHVDYDDEHNVNLEHKPPYDEKKAKRRSLREMLLLGRKKVDEEEPTRPDPIEQTRSSVRHLGS
ncbi:MAG: hypothetical protein Q9227_008925 [Pyrenula ochraceoflavens]